MRKINVIDNHFLSFVWLMLFIMPNNNIFYLFVPISFVILFNIRTKTNINSIITLVLLSLLITFLINIDKNYLRFKDYSRFVTLIIFVITFTKLRGSAILKPYIYFAVFFLVLSQFAFFLNISFLVDLINANYVSELSEYKIQSYENFQISEYGLNRLGGIYFNSNQYAKFIEFILLALVFEKNQFNKNELIFLGSIIIFSIVATGSRTSFIVLISILLGYLYFNNKLNHKNVVLLITISFLLLGYLLVTTNFSEFRMFKIQEGLDNSFGIKVQLFQRYLSDVDSPLHLLFGNLSTQVLIQEYGFIVSSTDFDLGNVTISYGLVFYLLFFVFCFISYKRMLTKYRVFFIILLWMLSSTIINSYRAAPIFFLMIGLYYKRSMYEKNENNIKIASTKKSDVIRLA